MNNKEQKIKEIIESVQKAADEALQKIKELENETEIDCAWFPKVKEIYLYLKPHGKITTNRYCNDIDKEWVARLAERGRIAPNTEEGRKTLEKRDEWFRFMFKFMTAGGVPANGVGYSFYVNICNNITLIRGDSFSLIGHRKFSTEEKIIRFIESFGGGNYRAGLAYIEKMLTGGFE